MLFEKAFLVRFIFPLTLCWSSFLWATTPEPSVDPEGVDTTIVVTANRLAVKLDDVPSSVTVITRSEIEESKFTYVLDALRLVPSLDIIQTGPSGGATSIFMRGTKSEHTLVLLDGIEINDPITPGRTVDLAHMGLSNVEQIEIIRGPQSTLYGSDAMGGVINIITRHGSGSPSGSIELGGGSLGSMQTQAHLSGSSDKLEYSIGASHNRTDGFSAASEELGNLEADGYKNTTVSGRLQLKANENLDFNLVMRYIDTEADIDNEGSPYGDDPNHLSFSEQVFMKLHGRLRLYDNLWEQLFSLSYSDHQRETDNPIDDAHPMDTSRSNYNGQVQKIEWQHNFYINPNNTLTLGLETERESGDSSYESDGMWGPYASLFEDQESKTDSVFLQNQFNLGSIWNTTLGVRYDDHERFGSETTYRVGTNVWIKATGTRIKGTLGTGFKSPTLYQLHSIYGNLELRPETSTGYDIGLSQSALNQKLTLDLTYFHNELEDMIDFDSVLYVYQNIAAAKMEGLELGLAYRHSNQLNLHAAFTHTETEDQATGKALLRRPEDKASLSVMFQPTEDWNLRLETLHTGDRTDMDFGTWPASEVTLDAFTVLNLAVSRKWGNRVEMWARVENLFDETYEQVFGYGTPGASYYGGIRYGY